MRVVNPSTIRQWLCAVISGAVLLVASPGPGSGETIIDIAGDWNYSYNYTETICIQGNCHESGGSFHGTLTISQSGSSIQWKSLDEGCPRAGVIVGKTIQVSGPIGCTFGVNFSTSTYTAQGQLSDDYNTISIPGSGTAVGTSPGFPSGTWHWSIAFQDNTTLTRKNPYLPLTIQVTVNQATFAAGQTLRTSASLTDPGRPGSADLYLGALLSDGVTIVFWTGPGTTAVGSLADLKTFRPYNAGVPLATPFSTNMPDFVTHQWTGTEPRGNYVFFHLAVQGGALAGGPPTSDQILGLATSHFAFP